MNRYGVQKCADYLLANANHFPRTFCQDEAHDMLFIVRVQHRLEGSVSPNVLTPCLS
jgi:hypothetical protein